MLIYFIYFSFGRTLPLISIKSLYSQIVMRTNIKKMNTLVVGVFNGITYPTSNPHSSAISISHIAFAP